LKQWEGKSEVKHKTIRRSDGKIQGQLKEKESITHGTWLENKRERRTSLGARGEQKRRNKKCRREIPGLSTGEKAENQGERSFGQQRKDDYDNRTRKKKNLEGGGIRKKNRKHRMCAGKGAGEKILRKKDPLETENGRESKKVST